VWQGGTKLLTRRRCSPCNNGGWPDELAARHENGEAATAPGPRKKPSRGCAGRADRAEAHTRATPGAHARAALGHWPGYAVAGPTELAATNESCRRAREGRASRARRAAPLCWGRSGHHGWRRHLAEEHGKQHAIHDSKNLRHEDK
jgi:hypothetical protein